MNCSLLLKSSHLKVLLVVFGLVLFGCAVLGKTNLDSAGKTSDEVITLATITSTPITPSPTSIPTSTPNPTNTFAPTATSTNTPSPTPISGTFENPQTMGQSIVLPIVPKEHRKPSSDGMGEMEFRFIEVLYGNEAKELAKSELVWYEEPIVGQEYMAIHGFLKQLWYEDNNELFSIYPYWSLTLRYSDGGYDIWSVDSEEVAEGYPPVEGEFWLFYLIKEQSQPYLYFQPQLIMTERLGIRNSGAYFIMSDEG